VRKPHLAFLIILLIVGTLPAELPKIRPELPKVLPLLDTGRVVVRVEKTTKSWRLLRGGWPYFIKGACVWGEKVRVEELKGAGANSMRTYTSKYAKWTLDQAHRRGMTVMLGFEASTERHGFLYTDPNTSINMTRYDMLTSAEGCVPWIDRAIKLVTPYAGKITCAGTPTLP
jgi:hypothetical protein